MSLFHPTEDDEAFARGHTEAALQQAQQRIAALGAALAKAEQEGARKERERIAAIVKREAESRRELAATFGALGDEEGAERQRGWARQFDRLAEMVEGKEAASS